MAGFETADEFVIRVDDGMAFETASNPSSSGNDSANALEVTSAGGAYEAVIMFPKSNRYDTRRKTNHFFRLL